MKKSKLALRIVLGIVALSHVIIGIIGVIPAIPINIVLKFYGSSITLNPQMGHIIQMFGAYMLTIGILGVVTLWNPVKNKIVVYGISGILFLRTLQRIIFANQQFEVFGISPAYYWTQTIIFFVLGLCLVIFTLWAKKSENT